jgi:hypothetical protein
VLLLVRMAAPREVTDGDWRGRRERGASIDARATEDEARQRQGPLECGHMCEGKHLALPLLVTRVRADHQNAAVPADDLALFAHRLDRGSYFHARPSTGWSGFSCPVILSPALETARGRRYRAEGGARSTGGRAASAPIDVSKGNRISASLGHNVAIRPEVPRSATQGTAPGAGVAFRRRPAHIAALRPRSASTGSRKAQITPGWRPR